MSSEAAYTPRHVPRFRRLDVRGIDYALTEWGQADGSPLLYLHGWGDTGSSFQFVADELADRHYIVAPDWRGFGRSSHNQGAYWFPDYLADLDRLIEALGIELPVRLIGHSMGANVAGLYAGAVPERVSHFINIEGLGLADAEPASAPRRYREWLDALRREPAFRAFGSIDDLAAHLRQRSPALTPARARFVAGLWSVVDETGVRLLADPRHKWPNPVLYRRAEAEACWRSITARSLLVTGANSRIVEAAGEHLPPASERLHIDGVGHMIHFEAPEGLAGAIAAFVAL